MSCKGCGSISSGYKGLCRACYLEEERYKRACRKGIIKAGSSEHETIIELDNTFMTRYLKGFHVPNVFKEIKGLS